MNRLRFLNRPDFYKSPGFPILLALAGAVSLGGYLLWSQAVYKIGYPLDDAWIHQTYARNLARSGEWVYQAGVQSAGSTSPLYTILLSIGYLAKINPYAWTFFLGWICLVGIALSGIAIVNSFKPVNLTAAIGIGLFLLFEWHLVWAAGSGMETLLFTWVVLLLMASTLKPSINWLVVGIIAGLSVWMRPDGITSLGPICLAVLVAEDGWLKRGRAFIQLGASVIILVVAYTIFNYLAGGNFLPNTFFAKQVEYSELVSVPLWSRLVDQLKTFLVGSGVVLLPGFILAVVHSVRRKCWIWLLWAAWVAGYIFMYAWRLPVTYQHGRYLIPPMAVFFVTGLAGMWVFLEIQTNQNLWRRVLQKSWLVIIGLVTVVFWILGARAYEQDVAIIETEMVDTANWIAIYTPEQTIVAAHDIGAIGYFSNRQLIDLAGLVSPEIIPILRDQVKLGQYLDQKSADFLVTFPGWYPELIRCLKLVYQTQGDISPAAGGENMAVYSLKVEENEDETCQIR